LESEWFSIFGWFLTYFTYNTLSPITTLLYSTARRLLCTKPTTIHRAWVILYDTNLYIPLVFFFLSYSPPLGLPSPSSPFALASKLTVTDDSLLCTVRKLRGIGGGKKERKKFLLQHVCCSVVCILYLPHRFCSLGCYTTYAGNLIHGEGFCLFLPRGLNFVFFLQLAGGRHLSLWGRSRRYRERMGNACREQKIQAPSSPVDLLRVY